MLGSPPLDLVTRQIRAAFADDPRPANDELLHERCSDDMDLERLYLVPHWTELTGDLVVSEYAALSFLSAVGFRHFLPAYMIWALDNPDSGAAAVDSTVWAVHPRMYGDDLGAFAESKYTALDMAQRAAVLVFLDTMAEHGHPDAAAASEHWREAGGAQTR